MKLRNDSWGFEDPPNAECADLRVAILEANKRGDARELEELRSLYGQAAHGGQGRRSAPHTPPARRTSPKFDDPKREIVMRIARFNEFGPWEDRDGKASWGYFRTGCFDAWLAQHSPAELQFSLEHESIGSLARWRDLWVTPECLWGVAVVERGAEAVLEYADSVATGCSVGADIVRSTERWGSRDNGEPIFDLHELRLLDAGPVADPADPECWIISVGGRLPWQHRVAEGHERHLKLAELGLLRRGGNGETWRPRFGA